MIHSTSQNVQGGLRAGVGKREITISAPDVAVNDPLFAKALVLEDGKTTVVIVAMDAVAIGGIADVPDDFLPKLRERITHELGIPGTNVLVNASHTHPSNRLLCDPPEQVVRVFEAVKEAHSTMEPVTVGAGKGYEDRIQINRILRLKNGERRTIRHGYPTPPDDEVEAVGPIDPEIGLLRVNRTDGSALAVVYNFACHTLIGVPSGAVTANFPGFASAVIEENLPGSTALFLQGAAGDVTELLYKDVNRPRDARPLGRMLGLSTLSAVRSLPTGSAEIRLIHETVDLPLRSESESETLLAAVEKEQQELLASLRFTSLNFKSFLPLHIKHLADEEYPADASYRYLQEETRGVEDLQKMDNENRYNLVKYLQNIRVMEKLAETVDTIETLKKHRDDIRQHGGATIRTEVIGLRIGEFVLLTSAAEVFTEIALDIKRTSPHSHTFLAAFTNGYLHYGAPPEDYPKRSYEVAECMLASEWMDIFKKTASRILQQL